MEKYQEVVDELAKNAETLQTEPPPIDLRSELRSHGRALRLTSREERPAEMRRYVRPLVDGHLQAWRLGLQNAPRLLVNVNNTAEQISADKSQVERDIASADARLVEFNTEVRRLREREQRVQREGEVLRPATPFSAWSYRILVIGSLLVGIVTAWYYLGMQCQLVAAKMNVPFISTLAFLQSHPEEGIYIFGVVIFLLAGKIISVIHARLGHPLALFLPVAIIAVSTTLGTVGLIASVSSIQQEMVQIQRSITLANPPGLDQADCSVELAESRCVKIRSLEEQLSSANTKMAGQGFWMTILVMSAEIFLGAVAWIMASEFHEKHGAARAVIHQKLATIREQLAGIADQIKQQTELRDRAYQARALADRLIHQLDHLKGKIPGQEFIDRHYQVVLDREMTRSAEVLRELEEEWAVQDVMPRSAP